MENQPKLSVSITAYCVVVMLVSFVLSAVVLFGFVSSLSHYFSSVRAAGTCGSCGGVAMGMMLPILFVIFFIHSMFWFLGLSLLDRTHISKKEYLIVAIVPLAFSPIGWLYGAFHLCKIIPPPRA